MALGQSLPTITNNLNSLVQEGLVVLDGQCQSTGGRKANQICSVSTARYAIGLAIFKDSINICSVDLYGQVIQEQTIQLHYKNSDQYYLEVCNYLNLFIESQDLPKQRLLGIGIATQGLVSQDGSKVIYGTILNNSSMTKDNFQKHLHYPCILLHDTKASALAEIWNTESKEDAIYLLLNNNFGGVLVARGQIHSGGSGIIEHMTLHPNGKPCYCGKRGCVEAYCSALNLKEQINCSFDIFFRKLRENDKNQIKIWKNYLKELALVIDNIRMIVNYKVIIGGFLRQYMIEEDFDMIKTMVEDITAIKGIQLSIQPSKYGMNAAPIRRLFSILIPI